MQLNAIILAAGKGKRMRSKDLPKVLHQLNGKPVLEYVLGTIREVGIRAPIIVVGFQGQKIIDKFPNYRFVWQKSQEGTAHAALQTRDLLKDKDGYTFILYGDNPLLSADTLKRITDEVKNQKATVAIASAKASEELELGHIVTDEQGDVTGIVEKKVADEETKRRYPWQNAGGWFVENKWLWEALPKINKNPVSGESYLTDLVELAVKDDKKVIAVPVADPAEAIGINTKEHLKQAEIWLHTRARG